MGTTSSARIIEYADMALEALEIVCCEIGDAVEGLADRNVQIQKLLVEGKSVSWGGARIKGEKREFELTKNMFLHGDLLKLCLRKKYNITELFSDITMF